MARGWESKSIEAQQEEAGRSERRKGGRAEGRKDGRKEVGPEERSRIERRRSLELARTRAADDLSRATAPAHRRMLEQALAALEAQLRDL
jgi:hypothetical protein